MAKKCKRVKEEKRIVLSKKTFLKREELKKLVKNLYATYEEKDAAKRKLNSMPRNSSPCRVRRRCQVCGRPRGVYRKFGLCRIHLREAFVRGDVPGLVKASW